MALNFGTHIAHLFYELIGDSLPQSLAKKVKELPPSGSAYAAARKVRNTDKRQAAVAWIRDRTQAELKRLENANDTQTMQTMFDEDDPAEWPSAIPISPLQESKEQLAKGWNRVFEGQMRDTPPRIVLWAQERKRRRTLRKQKREERKRTTITYGVKPTRAGKIGRMRRVGLWIKQYVGFWLEEYVWFWLKEHKEPVIIITVILFVIIAALCS